MHTVYAITLGMVEKKVNGKTIDIVDFVRRARELSTDVLKGVVNGRFFFSIFSIIQKRLKYFLFRSLQNSLSNNCLERLLNDRLCN